MPDEIKLEDDLEGLSAEELEKLSELDDGNAELDLDDQNFAIGGIDELNAEPAPTEEPPTEEPPADPAPVEEPEVDYKAKYTETMVRLAEQKLLADQQPVKPVEPENTRSLYEQAMDGVELTTDEQKKFDSYKEYDEDQAEIYKSQVKQKAVVEQMLKRQADQDDKTNQDKAKQQQTEQQQFIEAINKSDNLKNWQKDYNTWDDVQAMHQRMLRDNKYAGSSKDEQMVELEQRFAKFSGVESDQASAPSIVPPTNNEETNKKIADLENKTTPPTSLSSVAGGKDDNKPGRVKLDNSSDGVDIQILMDQAAASDDPDAIDKLLSSIDFE